MEPYGYLWFNNWGERRFTEKNPKGMPGVHGDPIPLFREYRNRDTVIEDCAKALEGFAGQFFVREMFEEAHQARQCAGLLRRMKNAVSEGG